MRFNRFFVIAALLAALVASIVGCGGSSTPTRVRSKNYAWGEYNPCQYGQDTDGNCLPPPDPGP